MSLSFFFSFQDEWQMAPMAYWVHVPVEGASGLCEPPAPEPIPHKGYLVLHVEFETHELQFSAPEQLDHFIEVLARKPLPTSRQLSARRGPSVGPNGHWLSRLPASLKSPRKRFELVKGLRSVRTRVVRRVPGELLNGGAAKLRFSIPDVISPLP